LFDEAMHTRAVGRLRLETELRTAVEKRQFRIFYQPVVRLDTRRITGFEALLRWQHPVQGLISPTHFLEAAEDSGLLVSIGHWLIAEACKQLVAWQVNNPTLDPVQVTVNVSARQFADARLVSDIEAALRQTGVEPSLLQLEMTENVVAADPKLTLAVLSHLKHLGIGMVLDDFGSGHSSLSQLRQFPVDALKIARSLIGEMMADNCSADMVALMIALAHKMNLKVIAEGIENAKQLQRLRELACEFGQGYLFSKPVEAQAAEQLLREQPSQAGASGA
jgi:EAL domain-containing protein (putative c-di-GMP-specific phosphodiesterase class I)